MSHKKTIAVLDGVRAIAILCVLVFHIDIITKSLKIWDASIGPIASAVAMAGWSGVTLFFVLSGFLLFMPYAKAILFDDEWPRMGRFYLRRMLRIFPGYYVSLFLLIILFDQQYLQPDHWKEMGLFLTFLMDSTRLTFRKLNGPFWTLAVEWQYYMLLPWLALGFRWLCQRLGGASLQRRWWTLVGCLCAMMVWGVAIRFWGMYYGSHPTETFLVSRPVTNVLLFFLFGIIGKFLEDFAVGMLISCCYVLSQRVLADHSLHWVGASLRRYSLWLWGGGVCLLFLMALWDAKHDFQAGTFWRYLIPPFDQFSELLLSLGYGACMTAVLFGPAVLQRPFAWGPLRWFGLISYSLYIWHLPLLVRFSFWMMPYTQGWNHFVVYCLYWLCAAVIVVLCSYLFYRCVEQPWMWLSSRWFASGTAT